MYFNQNSICPLSLIKADQFIASIHYYYAFLSCFEAEPDRDQFHLAAPTNLSFDSDLICFIIKIAFFKSLCIYRKTLHLKS